SFIRKTGNQWEMRGVAAAKLAAPRLSRDGPSVADGGTSQVLHDADWNVYNRFDNPDRVIPKQQPIKVNGSKMQLDLPRLSITTIIDHCLSLPGHRFASAPELASVTRRHTGYARATVCRLELP